MQESGHGGTGEIDVYHVKIATLAAEITFGVDRSGVVPIAFIKHNGRVLDMGERLGFADGGMQTAEGVNHVIAKGVDSR